jgi:hypothetical protein
LFIREKSEREKELWRDEIIMCPNDIERAMALLEGFDLVARIGEDFIVPGVLSPAVLPAKPVPCGAEIQFSNFSPPWCPRVCCGSSSKNVLF